ncbi:MAG: hypothetical protein IJ829_05220, partial [Kiritimatiellae bacterium]|nr:hypothetical protein [Kiritimatiellia bacterium]
MHRLLVDTAQLEGESPLLPAAAAAHLKVVRPKDDEEIELFDGRGAWRRFRVVRAKGGYVLAPCA